MKDQRFIELLNLYVDHHLTPHEARELDTELHANPARQRTYQQYCRMQKACAQLFENECAAAPATPALARAIADADRKISSRTSRLSRSEHSQNTGHQSLSRWWRGLFAIGGIAAATACGAIVFFLTNTDKNASKSSPIVATTQTPIAPATPLVAPAVTIAYTDNNSSVREIAPVNETLGFGALTKRFRLPVITSFASDKNAPASNTSAALTDENLFDWTKDLQIRPIRKVSADDAIAALRRFETPTMVPPLLRAPATNTQEPVHERTVIEFKR